MNPEIPGPAPPVNVNVLGTMKRRRVGGDSGDGDDGAVRVRSAEGEGVAWSPSAAARSAALANWVSDTGGAEGVGDEMSIVGMRPDVSGWGGSGDAGCHLADVPRAV